MRITSSAKSSGLRLDVFLAGELADLSRSRIQSLIKSGHITVNGQRIRAHVKVTNGMEIDVRLPPPVPAHLAPENIPLDILHEDGDIIVVNKPSGLTVHPAAGRTSGTLANALLFHCQDLAGIGGEARPGIVHRLDRDTSGVMVVAKNESAMASLTRQFKDQTVRKEYLALVHGIPHPMAGTIETLIGRSHRDRKKMAAVPVRPPGASDRATPVSGKGRMAVSRYKVEEVFGEISLVRVFPETGRTHQIRVHMARIGHPVLGDRLYGGRRVRNEERLDGSADDGADPVPRQMLHAECLSFHHPSTGREMTFKAPLPEDMDGVLARLRSSVNG